MPTIAIIDDRIDQRDSLKSHLDLLEHGDWEVIAVDPLSSLDEYVSWIRENDISVMLLDEKLSEVSSEITYSGHDLVDFLRARINTLPIFVITSFIDAEDLQSRFKDVEDIIDRNKFATESSNYFPRFFRAGQKYMEAFKQELQTISDVSKKIVENTATTADIQKLEAVRTKLEIEFDVEKLSGKSHFIQDFEEEVLQLNELKEEIKEFLNEHEMEKNN